MFPTVHGVVSQQRRRNGGGDGTPFVGVTAISSPGSSAAGGAFRLGWQFTVGASNLTVTKLRHYGNGATAGVWRVMVHRASDGAVMASADIAKVQNVWAEEDVTPVVLASGAVYTVSARCISGNASFWGGSTQTINPVVLKHGDGVLVGGGVDTIPTTPAAGATYVLLADFGGHY